VVSVAGASGSRAAVPEVGVVVGVGQTVTVSADGFTPKSHVKVWLLATPTAANGLCFNRSIPQGACGIDVSTWPTDKRGAVTAIFRWPSYFCTRGVRRAHCRKQAWRHGMRAVIAVYSIDLFYEAEVRAVVR
jgi:hypothetical protein